MLGMLPDIKDLNNIVSMHIALATGEFRAMPIPKYFLILLNSYNIIQAGVM
jgi:hypothetical protein